jgi:maltose-binding protein MalE
MFKKHYFYLSLILGTTTTGTTAAQEKEYILWHSYTEETTRSILQKAANEVKAKTGKTVIVEYIDNGSIKPNLLKNAKANKLPDMVFAAADFVGLYKQLNLSPISLPLKASKEQIQTVTLAGKAYGVPITGGNHLLFMYNKDLVKKPATSFEELVAEKKKSVKNNKDTYIITWNYDEPFWIAPFIGANGTWPIKNGKITLNDVGTGIALKEYYDLKEPLGLGDCDYACSEKAFLEGRSGYLINGIWAYGEIKKKLGDKLGVALFPTINGKTLTPMFSTIAILFPAQSLTKDKAGVLQSFVEIVQNDETQKRLAELGYLPVVENLVKSSDANWPLVIEQMKKGKPMPSEPAMVWAWEGLRKGWALYKSLREQNKPDSEKKVTKFMQDLATKEEAKAKAEK